MREHKFYWVINPFVACIAIGAMLWGLAMRIQRDRAWEFMIHDSKKGGVWTRDDITSSEPTGTEHWHFTPDGAPPPEVWMALPNGSTPLKLPARFKDWNLWWLEHGRLVDKLSKQERHTYFEEDREVWDKMDKSPAAQELDWFIKESRKQDLPNTKDSLRQRLR